MEAEMRAARRRERFEQIVVAYVRALGGITAARRRGDHRSRAHHGACAECGLPYLIGWRQPLGQSFDRHETERWIRELQGRPVLHRLRALVREPVLVPKSEQALAPRP